MFTGYGGYTCGMLKYVELLRHEQLKTNATDAFDLTIFENNLEGAIQENIEYSLE
jgi:hypothetical protein